MRLDPGSAPGEVRIGVVGYGAMGKAHAYGYTAAPVIRSGGARPRLTVLSGRNGAAVSAAAGHLGFEGWTTDWRELVASPEVDVVDICTPGRAPCASLRGRLVGDRPGCRLRRQLRQLPRRPALVVARGAMAAGPGHRPAGAKGLRGDGSVRGRTRVGGDKRPRSLL